MDTLMATMDMYFNLSSTSGLWSLKELVDFQQKAGLAHCKVNRFLGQPWFARKRSPPYRKFPRPAGEG